MTLRKAIAYWQVDAFASRPFAGNQAAVLLLEERLPGELLQKIAAELNLPATAFVVPDQTGADGHGLRWFSPTRELALCGHGTLAAGHVLLGREGGEQVVFNTRERGEVTVKRRGSDYELALPVISTLPADLPEAAALLGAKPDASFRSDHGYNILVYPTAAAVRALTPDLRGLAALGNDQFICTAPGDNTDIVSRVFVAGGGGVEDSVTGSAHAALAPYWAERLGRREFNAHQASERGGMLSLRLDGDRVWLSGACVTVSEGTFYLTG